MADLKDVQAAADADATAVAITINKKDGEPYLDDAGEPCTISVLGNEAPQVKKARAQQRRKLQRKVMAGGAGVEETDQADIEELAAAVVAWSGWTSDGEVLPCSRTNVLTMLKVEHIRNQVWTGVYQHSLFFEAASASSSDTPDDGRGSAKGTKTARRRGNT